MSRPYVEVEKTLRSILESEPGWHSTESLARRVYGLEDVSPGQRQTVRKALARIMTDENFAIPLQQKRKGAYGKHGFRLLYRNPEITQTLH